MIKNEAVARIIYESFPFLATLGTPHKPEWVECGNSIMQDRARDAAARVILQLETFPNEQHVSAQKLLEPEQRVSAQRLSEWCS